MSNLKQGFTLAEVLITLVIIGIIASMTIPSLMNKTNEQETVVAVKKAYSVLGQAYQRLIAENGEINPAFLGSDAVSCTENFSRMFVKLLNVQKDCGMSSNGDCMPDTKYKFFNGDDEVNWNTLSSQYKFQLSDGMLVKIWAVPNYQNKGESVSLQNVYGAIGIDVNGAKGPNTLGKDAFAFWITKYGIVPQGTPDDTVYPLSTCRAKGWGACTAWVTTKGNVDYWHKDVSW